MRIIHRVSLRATVAQRKQLELLGIRMTGVPLPGATSDPLVTLEIAESDHAWPRVSGLLAEWNAVDITRTEFSVREVRDAAWLQMVPAWHCGYPQPEDGYRTVTYDSSGSCADCGIGLVQKAEFRMVDEPRWGRHQILQLHWVFDEYFVTPEAWASSFEGFGVATRPVLNCDGGTLRTVLQLVINEEVPVCADGFPTETCSTCARTKVLPVTRGRFPALAREPSGAVARSAEYFGSGSNAYRPVIVRSDVAHRLLDARIRGVSFKPLSSGS